MRTLPAILCAIALTAGGQQIRPITQNNDINKVGDEYHTKPVTWFAGDSIRFDVYATDARTPVDFSGSAFPVLFVAAETNVAHVYIAATGTVVSATGGHVRVSVPAADALLDPDVAYAAWMTVFRVADALTQEVATVAYSQTTVLEAPGGTDYAYIGAMTNPPWQFVIGTLGGTPTNWSDYPAVSRVDLAGYGLTNGGALYGDARGLTNFPPLVASTSGVAASIAAATANMATGAPVYSLAGYATGTPVYSTAGLATGTPVYSVAGLATGTPIYSVAGLATGTPIYSLAGYATGTPIYSVSGLATGAPVYETTALVAKAGDTMTGNLTVASASAFHIVAPTYGRIQATNAAARTQLYLNGDLFWGSGTSALYSAAVRFLTLQDVTRSASLIVGSNGYFRRAPYTGGNGSGHGEVLWDSGQSEYRTFGQFYLFDATTNSYLSLSATGGLRVGQASFHAEISGDISQDSTNTAALGILTAQSLALGTNAALTSWAGFATGSPIYSVSGLATGAPVYAEGDPVFLLATGALWAAINARATGSPVYSVAGLATGTPVYSVAGLATGSPIYSTAGLATGSPVYAETDPRWQAGTSAIWSAISARATGSPIYSVAGLATGTPVYSLAGYATGTPIYTVAGLATGTPIYSLAGYATGTPIYSTAGLATGTPIYSTAGLATGTPIYTVAGLATGSPVYAESDPRWQAGTGALWAAIAARATGSPIYSVSGLATGAPVYDVSGLATGAPLYAYAWAENVATTNADMADFGIGNVAYLALYAHTNAVPEGSIYQTNGVLTYKDPGGTRETVWTSDNLNPVTVPSGHTNYWRIVTPPASSGAFGAWGYLAYDSTNVYLYHAASSRWLRVSGTLEW